jgi:hypothetical protein
VVNTEAWEGPGPRASQGRIIDARGLLAKWIEAFNRHNAELVASF